MSVSLTAYNLFWRDAQHTEVLKGVRTILRNVFVKPFAEVQIEGMKSWYQAMADQGAAFHFVSNSPWELSSVIRGYFTEAGLPPGQLTLKKYERGKGLLSGLWEPAGQRKQANVESVLNVSLYFYM